MKTRYRAGHLLLPWLLAVTSLAGQPAAPNLLLRETFDDGTRGWRVDDYSRIEQGGYVIDARQSGGYYRWIEQPANLQDFVLKVEVAKRRGNNEQPLYGVLVRVQDGWQNCYFFVLNGSGGYFFGKFQQGKARILKQGSDPAIHRAGETNTLIVRASGTLFGLAVNDTPLANVIDDTFPNGGRVGLCVEAPAMVWFDNLEVTTLAGTESGPQEQGPPLELAPLFADDFSTNTGWAVDPFRRFEGGAYHLANQGEAKSYLSWNPETKGLTDFEAELDARLREGAEGTLYGVTWRVRDGDHFYFFVIGADGRYYAGIADGDGTRVLRKGRQMAIRPLGELNTIRVRADGGEHSCGVNGVETCSFTDTTYKSGSLGVYLEQPGHVVFDDLLVSSVAPPPPTVGGTVAAAGPAGGWPTGALVLSDRLEVNDNGYRWPNDAFHAFDQGGYCVRAPDSGSRTVLREPTMSRADGVYMVNVRPVQGNLQGSYGMVIGASPKADWFTWFLINAAGRYFLGRFEREAFTLLDSGPVTNLRGGDLGNEMQVTVRGDKLTYGLNGQTLGTATVATGAGTIGLHVENGVVACFRNLRVFELPE